jgi:hypothetical protein
MLKRVFKELHPYEADLVSSFSTEPLSSMPDNHVAPIFAVLQSPHDENAQIFVMPFLRSFANPRFDTFGEAISFFDQIFRVCIFSITSELKFIFCRFSGPCLPSQA